MLQMIALIAGLFALVLGGAQDMRAGFVAAAIVVLWIEIHYHGAF